jgi:hypothetical protein
VRELSISPSEEGRPGQLRPVQLMQRSPVSAGRDGKDMEKSSSAAAITPRDIRPISEGRAAKPEPALFHVLGAGSVRLGRDIEVASVHGLCQRESAELVHART